MKALYLFLIFMLVGCYVSREGGPKMLGHQYMSSNNNSMPKSGGCEIMVEKYDDMEDRHRTQLAEPIILDDGKIRAQLDVQLGSFSIFKQVVTVNIKLDDALCVREYDAAIFKFGDGKTSNQIHDDGDNCFGLYTFNLDLMGRGSFKRKLASEYVTKIRVYYLDTYSDFELSVLDQNKIHAAINCVI